MTTGLDSFSDPGAIEAMYPFQGLEWLFVVVSVVLWLLWHWKYNQEENREYEDARRSYDQLRLERVMFRGGTALIPSEDELREQNPPVGEEPPLRAG